VLAIAITIFLIDRVRISMLRTNMPRPVLVNIYSMNMCMVSEYMIGKIWIFSFSYFFFSIKFLES